MKTARTDGRNAPVPDFQVRRIGIVSRDYNHVFPNGYRDFSYVFGDVLRLLDEQGCDAVLFSLYTLIPRSGFEPKNVLAGLEHVKLVGVEEFQDTPGGREAGEYVVYCKPGSTWQEHRFRQLFGKVNRKAHREAARRLAAGITDRIFGNCCFLICGESNAVKYDKLGDKRIHDVYGVRAAIPAGVNIILNPTHDRMARFEMPLKRAFLSAKGRWVVSVWNQGKLGAQGRTRDGSGPASCISHNGNLEMAARYAQYSNLEIGVIKLTS